ncbi:MAG: hypothetical protein DRQ78_12885 [Epsilonproteobacteria bacterium]|nr:MAG: hypothetical protein DRQ78_12885 [Campylobacterota bacterium]
MRSASMMKNAQDGVDKRVDRDLVVGYAYCKTDKTIALFEMPENHPSGAIINSFGGRIEEDETPEEAIIRECKEEVGYAINKKNVHLVAKGHVNTEFFGNVKLYIAIVYINKRKPAMNKGEWCKKPKWYYLDKIPWDKLPPDSDPFLKGVFRRVLNDNDLL